ncbi:MFS transporter [Cellulomonas sp. NPDC055163]
MNARPAPARLVRDRVTAALYACFGTWGWFLYSFVPGLPLLADELGITRAQAGLHTGFMACGTLTSGFTSAALVRRLGRRGVLLLAAGLLSTGVVALVSAPGLLVTLPAATVAATGGALFIAAAQPALTVHHGAAGPAAVSEGHGTGALVGLVGPLALGGAVALGWGWRPAVAVTVVLAAGTALLVARLPGQGALGTATARAAGTAPATETGAAGAAGSVDAPPAGAAGARPGRFSTTFWLLWATLVAVVAIENATTAWAADLLRTHADAGTGVAAGAVSGLIAGMCVARFAVGRLALRSTPLQLLLAAFAVAAAGWLVLWVATTPALALAGLVVAGLGYGAQFPLAISMLLGAADGRLDQAQARSTLGVGAAVAVAPVLLGGLADQVGTHTAFLVVPALIACGVVAVLLAERARRRHEPHPVSPAGAAGAA